MEQAVKSSSQRVVMQDRDQYIVRLLRQVPRVDTWVLPAEQQDRQQGNHKLLLL